VEKYGVFPFEAHVRVNGGLSRKPLSSINNRWAPNLSAFFYMRLAIPLPMSYFVLLPLQSSAFGFLTTPPHY
jgi:hypothetical protein